MPVFNQNLYRREPRRDPRIPMLGMPPGQPHGRGGPMVADTAYGPYNRGNAGAASGNLDFMFGGQPYQGRSAGTPVDVMANRIMQARTGGVSTVTTPSGKDPKPYDQVKDPGSKPYDQGSAGSQMAQNPYATPSGTARGIGVGGGRMINPNTGAPVTFSGSQPGEDIAPQETMAERQVREENEARRQLREDQASNIGAGDPRATDPTLGMPGTTPVTIPGATTNPVQAMPPPGGGMTGTTPVTVPNPTIQYDPDKTASAPGLGATTNAGMTTGGSQADLAAMATGGMSGEFIPATTNPVGPPWNQPVQTGGGDFEKVGDPTFDNQTRIENALMDRYRRLADPYFAREQERMESSLANRGLPTTGEAYADTTGQFQDTRNRSYADAADRAIMVGTAESQRLWQNEFSQNTTSANDFFRNRQLALQENLGQRGLDVQLRGQDIQESLGRAGIDMRGQELSAQQAIAQMQAAAAQGSAAAQRELGRLQMEENRRQFDLNMQFQQGQQGWQNAFQDRGWMFNADLTGRQQFFNEMGSFFPGSPMLGMPNVPYLDATGAYQIGASTDANRFQGEFDNRQAALDYNAGLWGGATDLAGAWWMRPPGT